MFYDNSQSTLCHSCNEELGPTRNFRCSRCKSVKYCSPSCQIKDWSTHKQVCNKQYVVIEYEKKPKVLFDSADNFGLLTRHGPCNKGKVITMLQEKKWTVDTGAHANIKWSLTSINSRRYVGMIVECDENGKYVGDGWNETTASFDSILSDLTQRGTNLNIHTWCVDKQGKVDDYDTKSFNCLFQTRDVVRVEVENRAATLLMSTFRSAFHGWLSSTGMTVDEHMVSIRNGTFPKRLCWQRAFVVKAANPDNYSIKFGSFGYRQSDGVNVFYVWG